MSADGSLLAEKALICAHYVCISLQYELINRLTGSVGSSIQPTKASFSVEHKTRPNLFDDELDLSFRSSESPIFRLPRPLSALLKSSRIGDTIPSFTYKLTTRCRSSVSKRVKYTFRVCTINDIEPHQPCVSVAQSANTPLALGIHCLQESPRSIRYSQSVPPPQSVKETTDTSKTLRSNLLLRIGLFFSCQSPLEWIKPRGSRPAFRRFRPLPYYLLKSGECALHG